MSSIDEFITASEASKRLGVSVKALRLYEERGLITPIRTEAGWRAYGPGEMSRAAQIATLRGLGLSLGQIARVFDGDAEDLDRALTTHFISLRKQVRLLEDTMVQVRVMRAHLSAGWVTDSTEILNLVDVNDKLHVAFDLPWPWGGERFELHEVHPLNFITGPLGSGKTRLAKRIAETLPGADFLGTERLADEAKFKRNQCETLLNHRVDQAMVWLLDEGATSSEALHSLVVEVVTNSSSALVIDMPEQGLNEETQTAVVAYLRCGRKDNAQPLFLLTRSSAILDMALVGRDETIIYCPANHSPPMLVEPFEGAPGYEAVAACLAAPDVRARTEGVIAIRQQGRQCT